MIKIDGQRTPCRVISFRNFFFSSLFSSPDPTPDKKPPKPQIQFSRTPHKQNTLDDDLTKPENKTSSALITKRMNSVNEDFLQCPMEREAKFELFPAICKSNQECANLGKNFRCCKLFGSQRCHEGLEKPLEDIDHERKRKLKDFNRLLNSWISPFSTFWDSPTLSEAAARGKLLGR